MKSNDPPVSCSCANRPTSFSALPSILDVMSSQGGTRAKRTGMTAGDLASLKALYYRNTAFDGSPTRIEVEHSMSEQLKGELKRIAPDDHAVRVM